MSTFQSNLLRRTAVALAAVAGFLVSTAPQAASITLSGVSGNNCTYNSMSVQPDGSFTVACTTGQQPPPDQPGTVALSNPGTGNINSTVVMSITRSGGSSGAASVFYNVAGGGCTATTGQVQWAAGEAGAKTFNVSTTGSVGAVCTINIGGESGVTVGAPAVIQFALVDPNSQPPGPTPPPGCPAAPEGMLSMALGGLGNPLLAMAKSNQIVSMPLPATQPGYSTGQLAFSESAGGAYTPQPVTLIVSISKCPGVIDTDSNNRCNLTSTNGNYNSLTWFSRAYSIIAGSAQANLRGYCWAPSSEGPWFVNAKWTYSQCAFGAQTCGFAVQQNYGPY